MTARQDADVLSLRVMRLNRPVLTKQQCEPAEFYWDEIAGVLNAADASVHGDLDGVTLHRLPVSSDTSESVLEDDDSDNHVHKTAASDNGAQDFVRIKVGGPGELLTLPQSFGSTYLGETFSAHVNLYNESTKTCHNVELKVALHNRIEWIPLFTSGHSIPALSPTIADHPHAQRTHSAKVDLLPGHSLNAVIHHEMKELGTHTLRCAASYCLPTSSDPTGIISREHPTLEPFTFQRLYKFTVCKPLDVKKKFSFVESDGSVFMEAQVHNLTSSPILLERVVLDPSPGLNVLDVNPPEEDEYSGQSRCLRPDDIRQFLYQLIPQTSSLTLPSTHASVSQPGFQNPPKPLNPASSIQHPPISAGRLDITWRSTMGERGRLQTSSLKYEVPSTGDLQLKVKDIPSSIRPEQPFSVLFELTNNSQNHLDLMLDLHALGTPNLSLTSSDDNPVRSAASTCITHLPALVWFGLTTRHLGGLPPGRSLPFNLDVMATCTGLQVISGLHIHELTMDRGYEFNDLGHVLVVAS